MAADEKICPRCAETVKAAAVVCKHCGANLPPALPEEAEGEAKTLTKQKWSPNQKLGCLALFVAAGLIGLCTKDGKESMTANSAANESPVEATKLNAGGSEGAYQPEAEVRAQSRAEEDGRDLSSVTASGLRALCYLDAEGKAPHPDFTFGDFIALGESKGVIDDVSVERSGANHVLRLSVPDRLTGASKSFAFEYEEVAPRPSCGARKAAALVGAAVDGQRLNAGNAYVAAAMINAIVLVGQ